MIYPYRGSFTLTQPFGVNKANYVQFGLLGHNGLDYGLPSNTQVIAPHDGKVIETAFDATGYGNYLKIENAKEGSVLAHLASFQVKVGDTVSQGQPVALSNNTGNSTGSHLHWGYYLFPRDRTNGYAGFINQLPLLTQLVPDLQKFIDELRIARDNNWNLYQAEVTKTANLTKQVSDLKTQVSALQARITKIKTFVNGA